MTDVHSKKTRSYNMSRIRGKNTMPEMVVRKFFFSKGIRYRIHDNTLPGKPDLVFPKYKIVLFVNGCFWHGHQSCRYFVIPKTRTKWWLNKIERTQKNDFIIVQILKEMNYKVLHVWECELKSEKLQATLDNLLLEFH